MKIVINALSARIGGGQTYLRQLLSRVPERIDLEILVFAPQSLELPSHPAITRQIPDVSLDNPLVRTCWEKFVLPRKLRVLRPDVYFCPGGVVTTKVPGNCRVVTMFRNMVPFDDAIIKQLPLGLQRLRVVLLKKVMLHSMVSADLVIFISKFARSVIESHIKIKRAVTIPHGIASSFRHPDRSVSVDPAMSSKPYILYVSRFESYKHHPEVVAAYLALPKALQETYDLVLVGENDNALGENVRRLIENSAAQRRVHMLGGIKYTHLPHVYRGAALIVFASSCENCPNILLEALSAGRPIICSNVMPMPEFGGEAVAYFNPMDVRDTSEKMQLLLTDAELAKQYANQALIQGLKFDWDVAARKTWEAIFALPS